MNNGLIINLTKNKPTENTKIKLRVFVSSNTGAVRTVNEDNYYIDELGIRDAECVERKIEFELVDRRTFAVFDGMGGESLGDVASKLSAEVMCDFSEKIKFSSPTELPSVISDCLSTANNKICYMTREKKCGTSGSTAAIVSLDRYYTGVFSIGDSRVYSYKNGILRCITEDQTLAVKKLKANIYTEEEALTSPDAHKLTSFIGIDNRGIGISAQEYGPFTTEEQFFLICSDGLTDMCSDSEIQNVFQDKTENNIAEILTELAIKNGGADNVTCIVIQIVYEGN